MFRGGGGGGKNTDRVKEQQQQQQEDELRNQRAASPPPPPQVYALKSIQLDRISPLFLKELENEIDILRTLDHPNIVKAHEVYWASSRKNPQIYIVMDCCDGGDLYTRSPYSERQSARITANLVSAIKYMHDHGIVHRDLKFENIMFESRSRQAQIKILDFGLSKKFCNKPGIMTDRVGTIYTMAPQVLQGIYSSQADLWAIGVISFMLLSSAKPFYSKRRHKMIDLIMRADYSFQAPVWETVSSNAKNFVSQLLVVDPNVRMDAAAALQHTWLVNREQMSDEVPSQDLLKAVDGCLLNYVQASSFKKLALNVIAHQANSSEDILRLRNAFKAYDPDNNGVITYQEFEASLKNMNYSTETIQDIFDSIDLDQDGYV
jgi:calcium-dependent protein kinase